MDTTKKYDLIIVIPTYNESKSLRIEKFISFLNKKRMVGICFVNDGSTDGTKEILTALQQKIEDQIFVLDCIHNKGKAEATRAGMNYCNEHFGFDKIAYLDADLATSLEECYRISKKVNKKLTFVFGSRIKILGSRIERNAFRFVTGRVIATVISKILNLGVYDTQCGVKVFSRDLSTDVFLKSFLSKWLFDVEIFFRIIQLYSRQEAVLKMKEIPLTEWVDKGDSKVKMSYFFKLWLDLYKINQVYNKQ
ncbi:MAG: glycosyltransferase [Wenyingzhuangia sp.]